MTAPVALMVLVTASVLLWPGGERGFRRAQLGALSHVQAQEGGRRWTVDRIRGLLDEDPVEVLRRWWRATRVRSARHGADFEAQVLALLDAIEPGLRAGLTPARAFDLGASAMNGSERHSVPDGLVRDVRRAGESGSPAGAAWRQWADDSGSPSLRFVASAWQLSERTGAPLADAVSRSAARTRSELSRRRRVSAAVAGPRATVNVLTALPLVGPLFALASGLDPLEVYGSSPFVLVALFLGVALILVGRRWCRRLVNAVLGPA
jgi:tight adherence protein B